MKARSWLLLIWFALLPGLALGADLSLLVIDGDSYITSKAVEELGTDREIVVVTAGELKEHNEERIQQIENSKVIIVDVMGRELEDFVSNNVRFQGKYIYALRSSIDDEPLIKRGFLFDQDIAAYFDHLSVQNIQNMLRLALHRHFDDQIQFKPVEKVIQLGLYHPEAERPFVTAQAYETWLQSRVGYTPDNPRIGLMFFSSSLNPGQKEPVDYLIHRLEQEGYTVYPCFGRDEKVLEQFLINGAGSARVDLAVAMSLKFYSALTEHLAGLLRQLDVPLINGINLYQHSLDQWRKSPVGIGGGEVTWALSTPEISGIIEPTPLAAKMQVTDPDTGRSYFLTKPIEENVERLLPRIKNWLSLQRKPNGEKKIALMFYNHHQGKQNIGASYLNVFGSLRNIISALADAGYQTDQVPDEEEIQQLILTSARNIGSWAPGELQRMLRSQEVIRVPVKQYIQWFSKLPEIFQQQVIEQWGRPEEFTLMKEGDSFVVPAVRLGNIILLPEPARGISDDPMKLYHDTTIFPHHQYLAVYLWLAHGFQADAMIHLGTHSTYEWTPGKQAGLSPHCSPEVLIGDVPNIYPYIVDNVGEGIQAKRRGRGVIISHLTPPLLKAGLHKEYSRMAELVSEYERAQARRSDIAEVKYQLLMNLAQSTGILKDIQQDGSRLHQQQHLNKHHHDHQHDHAHQAGTMAADKTVHLLGHYLAEVRENLMPFGLHHFGKAPVQEAAESMATHIVELNPDENFTDITHRLAVSAGKEIKALIRGLQGGYVQPGEGNDPIRNPNALPTGRNFYGHNPQKLPTPAAWELGKRAAEEIITNYVQKNSRYPRKVAVVLWATETLRNEGVNESTLLYLMGVKPKWSKGGRVTGVEIIPGTALGRPRIDVFINASGLYRDLFPDKMELIDKAVKLALLQTDIDNLLAENSRTIKTDLVAQGMDESQAEEFSRLRIFSENPGAYGNGVSELASASGVWEDEQEIVDVFTMRSGFAYGGKHWGIAAEKSLKEQLKGVEVALHSSSSNVYGLLDNDDFYQYLGGLAMAVRNIRGETPQTLVARQQQPGRITVEDVAKTLGREMRSRYLNPGWIEGMKAEGYAGAREMAHYVEYLWGWQVTTPDKIDASKWQQTYEVYVQDKYEQGLEDFFNQSSPWAHQSITSRMLESVRKGYWQADEDIQKQLAARYAVSVVEKGVACCEHTCNNPMLNQMVVSLISLPGVLSPELVEQFKIAVEKMAGKTLDDQMEERKVLQQQLRAAPQETRAEAQQEELAEKRESEKQVEGYSMEKLESEDEETQMMSSGVEWLAGVVVLMILGLLIIGAMRKKA